MRTVICVLLVLSACGDPESARVDAAIVIIDSKPVDAAVPDSPPPDAAVDPAIAAACMNACDALAMCFGGPSGDPDCNMGCAEDLVDCTSQQLADIDACLTEECGDDPKDPENSPLIQCIMAVPCVEM